MNKTSRSAPMNDPGLFTFERIIGNARRLLPAIVVGAGLPFDGALVPMVKSTSTDQPSYSVVALMKTLPLDHVSAAEFVAPSSLRLRFADGLSGTWSLEQLGINASTLMLTTFRVSSTGTALEVHTKTGGVVPLDSSALRARVDARFGTRIGNTLDEIFALNIQAENTAKAFAELAARWKKETRLFSMTRKVFEHPAYRQIIAMGQKAIPLILADLEKTNNQWFAALREITGANPVPQKDCGTNNKELVAMWIAWGKANGYRW